ncbi:hypothetical protein CPARA_1gp006 (nucleomorph) [Cryptomonas paramecium]|uniref:Uncharacterized protein n=1 Tax=Cryptomonas paramaecium TaxID=2898 RepID=F2HH68_9CRYP|nr:hypothetical protein CPARA_1gp006 [Cryptomonas paramecium]AEA38664.1 hypothetical protein CPARA_1gp006 [Cryptomonas paramecium]
MFLQLLKIFLKNKKIILYKKTKYNEFIQNELLYHIFSYFLSNTFFLNLEMLIKYISFYKKNIFFLFQEFKQTSTFININQLSKKKYILKNFSKSFFFHSQYMLISKIKNLIIRKINPILSTCIQFEYLFKKKAKLNSFFLNKTFLCNFCIYNRTGNAYEFKKTYSIIKKIQNYTCYSTLNLIKKRCKTAVDRFLITLFQLRINLENEWYFRIYCAINHTSFQNLFENFSKKNLVYKKFFHFEDFLILSEIRTQKKKTQYT